MSEIESLFREISNSTANIIYEKDYLTNQQYLIFNNIEDILTIKDKLKNFINPQTEAAIFNNVRFLDFSKGKVDNHYLIDKYYDSIVSIKLDKKHLILIYNANLAHVRKNLLDDHVTYPYSISFKNAEYHSYCELKNLKTNKVIYFGSSVYPFNRVLGSKIIRIEDVYDKKYYKGNIFVNHGELNPKIDKGCIGIEMLITQEQVDKIYQHLNKLKIKFENDFSNTSYTYDLHLHPTKKIAYFLIGKIKGTEPYNLFNNNCHNDVQNIYKVLGFKDHFFNFMRADNADLNDMGEYYDFWSAHGSYNALIKNYHISYDILVQHYPKLFGPQTYKLDDLIALSQIDRDLALQEALIKDLDGNNALNKALLMEDIKKALVFIEIGIDLNITNRKGQLPLHLASSLPPSDKKQLLLEKIISGTSDINQIDLYEENIPLTYAVLANDPDTINLLAKNGGNIHYINNEFNNLGIIASINKNAEALEALYKLDSNIVLFDNLTKQIPIHEEGMNLLALTPNIDIKPKDQNSLYLIIEDIDSFFSSLHSSDGLDISST